MTKPLSQSLPPNLQLQITLFPEYMQPNGYLTQDRACHALFFYYLNAQRTYEQRVQNNLVYEGELDSDFNFEQAFLSISRLYDVRQAHMASFWSLVDKQCELLELPLLPDTWNYRFKSAIIIH